MTSEATEATCSSGTISPGKCIKGAIFRTSPLIDVNNKFALVSPQTELSCKLQMATISNNEDLGNENINLENFLGDTFSNAPTVFRATAPIDVPFRKSPRDSDSPEIKEESDTLPDHVRNLISSVPKHQVLSNIRRGCLQAGSRASGGIKRSAFSDDFYSITNKKLKFHSVKGLEIIQESSVSPISFTSRLRSGSVPTPLDSQTPLTRSITGGSLSCTPEKVIGTCKNESILTPNGVGNRSKASMSRKKLPASKSMEDLIVAESSSCTPLCDLLVSTVDLKVKVSPLKYGISLENDCGMLIGDMSKKCLLVSRLYDGVPVVDCEEVAKLLEGDYYYDVERVYIIDCRFPYEFKGGHIKGAVNFPHPFYENLKSAFFEAKDCKETQTKNAAWSRSVRKTESIVYDRPLGNRIIVIFHCEFSSHRAPNTFRWFRTEDRNYHTIVNYPKLDYPEAYVLKGGYKAFVNYCHQAKKPHLCEPPGGYVKQGDYRYKDHLRRFQRRIKTMSELDLTGLNQNINTDQRTEFIVGSPDSVQSLEDAVSRQSQAASGEFDDDDSHLKICTRYLRFNRRVSDCPKPSAKTLLSGCGRASFEELSIE